MNYVRYKKDYKKSGHKKNPKAIIRVEDGRLLLTLSDSALDFKKDETKYCRLYFDDDTFNIKLVISPDPRDLSLVFNRTFNNYRVTLAGFISKFDLDVNDIVGRYDCEKGDDKRSVVILHETRSPHTSPYNQKRKRLTVSISEEQQELWDELRGKSTWSSFIRMCCDSYVKKKDPELWLQYIEGGD